MLTIHIVRLYLGVTRNSKTEILVGRMLRRKGRQEIICQIDEILVLNLHVKNHCCHWVPHNQPED